MYEFGDFIQYFSFDSRSEWPVMLFPCCYAGEPGTTYYLQATYKHTTCGALQVCISSFVQQLYFSFSSITLRGPVVDSFDPPPAIHLWHTCQRRHLHVWMGSFNRSEECLGACFWSWIRIRLFFFLWLCCRLFTRGIVLAVFEVVHAVLQCFFVWHFHI